MPTCTIIGTLVLGCLAPAERPTPTEAARMLLPRQYVHVEPAPPGPTWAITDNSPTDGPFGPLRTSPNTRRLDGSYYWEPLWRSITYLRRGDERRHLRTQEQRPDRRR